MVPDDQDSTRPAESSASLSKELVRNILDLINNLQPRLREGLFSLDASPVDPNALEFERMERDLTKLLKLTRRLCVTILLGDYAGHIWKCLRQASQLGETHLPDSVVAAANVLRLEEKHGGETLDALEAAVTTLLEGVHTPLFGSESILPYGSPGLQFRRAGL
ncbi:hypothetical protein N7540_000267 [Penicillium herquei]|nr:hypothetical protein N7540_000267 [Penicillium herquei]